MVEGLVLGFYSNSFQQASLSFEAFWERLKSSGSSSVLPAYSVIGLTVVDPRLGMPGIRTSIDASLAEQHKGIGNTT